MLPEFIDSLRQMEIILKDGSYYEIEKEDLIAGLELIKIVMLFTKFVLLQNGVKQTHQEEKR